MNINDPILGNIDPSLSAKASCNNDEKDIIINKPKYRRRKKAKKVKHRSKTGEIIWHW